MEISRDITKAPLVVLTGAGASVPLGKFTTSQFIDHLLLEIGTLDAVDAEAASHLRTILRGVSAKGLDVEDVLATFENRAQSLDFLMADPVFHQAVLKNDTLGALKYRAKDLAALGYIYDEVIRHYGEINPTQAGDLYRGLIGNFRFWFDQIVVQPTLPFFTLNYDCAVETAASDLGVTCIDGIQAVRGKTERRWVKEAFHEYTESPDAFAVVLVKLHGSVRLGRKDLSKYGLGDDELVELTGGLGRDPEPYTHAVLYPTRNSKEIAEDPFYTHYRVLASCLLRARLLLVIGCSLRDRELQGAVRTACEDNAQLRLLVVDPAATHDAIAELLHIPPQRVAVQQQEFRVEDAAWVAKGHSPFMGMVRGYLASSLGEASSLRTYPFGKTAAASAADWPTILTARDVE